MIASFAAELQLIFPAAPKAKAKRVIKSRQSLAEKQPGTTLFPIARVKKIIKADKDVDTMSAEATFLIAAATVSRAFSPTLAFGKWERIWLMS